MSKLTLKDIKLLIKKAKEGDLEAKMILFKKHFEIGCAMARKYLSKNEFLNLKDITEEEIKSIAYQAFETAIRCFSLEKSKSFKNYLIMMVRYQVINDSNLMLNHQINPNHYEYAKNLKLEINNNDYSDKEFINKANNENSLLKITKYLENKKSNHLKIMTLKMNGFSNKEISLQLGIKPMAVKSSLQYMRKLIKKQFNLQN